MTQLAASLGTLIGTGVQKYAAFPKFLTGLSQKLPALGTAVANKASQGAQWASDLGQRVRGSVGPQLSHLRAQAKLVPTRLTARGQGAVRGALTSGAASALTSGLTGNPIEPGVVGTSMLFGGLLGGARKPNYSYAPGADGKLVPNGMASYSSNPRAFMQQGMLDAAPGVGLSLLRGQVNQPYAAAAPPAAAPPAAAPPAGEQSQGQPNWLDSLPSWAIPAGEQSQGQPNWLDSLPSWAIPAGAAALAAPLAGSLMRSTTDKDDDNRGLLSALGMLGGGAGAAYLANQYSPEIRQFLSGLGQSAASQDMPQGMLGGGAGAESLANQYSPKVRQFLSSLEQLAASQDMPQGMRDGVAGAKALANQYSPKIQQFLSGLEQSAASQGGPPAL